MEFDKEKMKDMSCIFDNVVLGKNVVIFPFTVVGRPSMTPKGTTTRIDSSELKPTIIGDNCVIGSNVVIYHGCTIGNNCLIGDGAKLLNDVTIGNNTLVAMNVKVGYNTTIGDRVKIMDFANISGGCVIEDECFISQHVSMANDNTMGRGSWDDKAPIIMFGATIGQNATLMPNIRIGKKSLVAGGSVVLKDVEDYSMVVGVPAHHKRYILEE